jgi:tetratricopeptide (TPR) repeat protein
VEEGVFAPLEAAGWLGRDLELLAFRVPALQEALRVGAEGSGRAAVWHGAAAELLSERGDVAAGRHFALAGRHAEALGPLRRAAADAVNRMQLEPCRALIALWERSADAVGMALEDPRRASVIVVRVHLALHTQEDPEGLLQQGLALVAGRDVLIEAQLHYTRGWVLARAGRHGEADPSFVEAVRLAEGQGELVAVAQLGRAASLFARGVVARGLVVLARGRLGPGQEALGLRADACLGKGLCRLGFSGEARRWLLRAAARAERAGAREVEAEAVAELAELSWAEGEYSEAVRWMERAVGVLAGSGSDLAWGVAVRLAGFLWGTQREEEARTVLAPIRQRFLGRLRGPVRAEWALVHGLLNGEDVRALLEPGAGVEEGVRRRLEAQWRSAKG